MHAIWTLITDTWRSVASLGRRTWVVYFDRTPKQFRDTRVMWSRRKDRR